ncbi:MAG: hypothetical protein K0M50_02865 [Prolixibacteraceae bacterium]|nr:hypothetical protein [Prolixibacteraceae bacterium]
MKALSLFIILSLSISLLSKGQYVTSYYDPKRIEKMSLNYISRILAEKSLSSETDTIKKNVEKISLNTTKLVAAKTIIYKSLVTVNEAIKDGKEIMYIGQAITDIIKLTGDILDIAKDNPELVLIATKTISTIKLQAIELYNEISKVITKEGSVEVMMDYNQRDELLRDISTRLSIIRGGLYAIYNGFYYAKMNGIWKSLNPFQSWVNQDKQIIDNILRNTKRL